MLAPCELPVHTLTADDVAKHKATVSSDASAPRDVSDGGDAAAEAAAFAAKDPVGAAETLRLAGNECFGAKRFAEAVEHYTEALSLDCDNGLIHGNRCAALLQLGKPRDALKDAKRMALLLPENPKAHFRLGGALAACDMPADACRAFCESLRLDAANEAVADALRKELARPALKKGKQHASLVEQCQAALAERSKGPSSGAKGDVPRLPWRATPMAAGCAKPQKRGGAAICAASGRLWLIGGADRTGTVHGDVWEYAPSAATAEGQAAGWRCHGTPADAQQLVPRCGHAAAVVGLGGTASTGGGGGGGGGGGAVEERIFIFGGQEPTSQSLLGDLACLRVPVTAGEAPTWESPARLKTDGAAPEARTGHSLSYDPTGGVAVVGDGQAGGGCLLVFAGANEEGHTADVHRLSLPSAGTASAGTEAGTEAAAAEAGAMAWDAPKCTGIRPSPREMHIASLLPSSRLLVVHGGRSGDAVLCDVCVLNVATWVWSTPVETPCQRVGHASALVPPPLGGGGGDGRLLLFGGFSGATFCNDVWEVRPTRAAGADLCERLPAQESPARRFAHTMASLGEVLFVFGGSGGSDELDDLHEADAARTLAASVPPAA